MGARGGHACGSRSPSLPKARAVSEQALSTPDVGVELLLEAGAVLASSLELATTMDQVARLTVPRLADLCVIDLRDEDGSIREVAVAAVDAEIAGPLEALRREYPLDPAGGHPVARVIRDGEPELLSEMTSELMRSFAQGSEHARFMIDHRYHSAVVAPLVARGRTLGALSVLRLGDSEPYASGDLQLACELARRAAMAIDNARLFSALRRVEQRLEAVLVNVAEAITLTDERGQHGLRQPGRRRSAGREDARRADECGSGDDHAALYRAGRERSRARPGEYAGQTPVQRPTPTGAAPRQEHRARHRRGALADCPLLAGHRPRRPVVCCTR